LLLAVTGDEGLITPGEGQAQCARMPHRAWFAGASNIRAFSSLIGECYVLPEAAGDATRREDAAPRWTCRRTSHAAKRSDGNWHLNRQAIEESEFRKKPSTQVPL
jgi:hypothetical protein